MALVILYGTGNKACTHIKNILERRKKNIGFNLGLGISFQ